MLYKSIKSKISLLLSVILMLSSINANMLISNADDVASRLSTDLDVPQDRAVADGVTYFTGEQLIANAPSFIDKYIFRLPRVSNPSNADDYSYWIMSPKYGWAGEGTGLVLLLSDGIYGNYGIGNSFEEVEKVCSWDSVDDSLVAFGEASTNEDVRENILAKANISSPTYTEYSSSSLDWIPNTRCAIKASAAVTDQQFFILSAEEIVDKFNGSNDLFGLHYRHQWHLRNESLDSNSDAIFGSDYSSNYLHIDVGPKSVERPIRPATPVKKDVIFKSLGNNLFEPYKREPSYKYTIKIPDDITVANSSITSKVFSIEDYSKYCADNSKRPTLKYVIKQTLGVEADKVANKVDSYKITYADNVSEIVSTEDIMKGDKYITCDATITPYEYTAEPDGYTVHFDANTGVGSMDDMEVNLSSDTTAKLTKNTYTKTGYHFIGWSDNASATSAKYTDEQDIISEDIEVGSTLTLYAVWQANTYTIRFNHTSKGDIGLMPNLSMTYDVSKNLTLNNFSLTGYVFKGWTTTENGTTVEYTDGQSVKNLTTVNGGYADLYPVFEPWAYTIKFNSNGGTGTMADLPMTYGTSKTLTANTFTKQGYTFKGWAIESNATDIKYANNASVNDLATAQNDVITLYALWTPKEYKIKFNANGGTLGSVTELKYTYDDTLQLPSINEKDKIPSRTNKVFVGWTLQPQEDNCVDETTYSVISKSNVNELGFDLEDTTKAVTLYALWADGINVSFVYDDDDVQIVNADDNGMITVPDKIPTLDGKIFIGYSKERQEDVSKIEDLPQIVDFTKPITESMQVYPVFATFNIKKDEMFVSSTINSLRNADLKYAMPIEYETNLPNSYKKDLAWTVEDDSHITIKYDTSKYVATVIGKTCGYTTAKVIYNNQELGSIKITSLFNDVITDSTTDTYKAIYWAADDEQSITKGYKDGQEFKPNDNCTRAHFATFLWRCAKRPDITSGKLKFPDVKNASTSDTFKAIKWCSDNGIVKGYTEGKKVLFKPDNNITRKEAMIMIYRYAKITGFPTTVEASDVKTFKDITKFAKTSDSYKSIVWGASKEITKGYNDGTFGIDKKCIRSAVVIFLYRMDKILNSNKN